MQLKDPNRWKEIAAFNDLRDPDHLLVGQKLTLPGKSHFLSRSLLTTKRELQPSFKDCGKAIATHFPAKCFTFMIGDEILPNGTAVRKIMVPKNLTLDAKLVEQIINPEKFGIQPIKPNSPVSIGRHVLGMTDSKFISVSTLPKGSPRFGGAPYWINIDKVIQSGATIHYGNDIIKDLERIAEKSANKAEFLKFIEDIKYKSSMIDKEMLIEGSIPAKAVKGSLAKGLTTGFKVWTGVGIVLSVHDLSKASVRSYKENSIKPIAAQTIREVGGWGGAFAGAKIGTAAGGLIGIETGPGAVFTAAAGGLVFGIGGYFGAEWIADYIEETPQRNALSTPIEEAPQYKAFSTPMEDA